MNSPRIPILDTTTQVLDLSYNNFHKINENVFRDRNLYNLQKVFLHHCSISMVVGRCFEDITNLVEVDLSWNLLNMVPKEALMDCTYLMSLNLRGNPIRQVEADAFQELQELQTLDLSQCQISTVHNQVNFRSLGVLGLYRSLRLTMSPNPSGPQPSPPSPLAQARQQPPLRLGPQVCLFSR